MKLKFFFTVIFFGFHLINCQKNEQNPSNKEIEKDFVFLEIPNVTVDITELTYENKISKWKLDDKNFSGFVLVKNEKGTVIQKFGLLDGMKQNESKSWTEDGRIKNISSYYKGRLHGEYKTYSVDSNHALTGYYTYYDGKVHGQQKKWYPTGELHMILNMNMGIEEGIQQAFRKNGTLYANYEAKNGRIFGLKKASLCFGLEDQKIKK